MSKVLPQLTAGVLVSFGSFCIGTTIGWAAQLQEGVLNGDLGYEVSRKNFRWLSALMLLGAATICIPIGFIINLIGRKLTMIFMCVPGVLGWIFLLCRKSLVYGYVGRYLMGISGGSFCIAIIFYTTEVAELGMRGKLGSLFQLMIVTGILLAYIIGAFCNVLATSIFCAFQIGILFFLLLLIPESPACFIRRKNTKKAQNSLDWLRGKNGDATDEFNDMINADKQRREQNVNCCKAFCSTATLKGLFMCTLATLVQQFGGINAIVFYGTHIFQDTNIGLDAKYIVLIFGALMWVSALISTLIIERAGRRFLISLSGGTMAICCALIGFFFFQKNRNEDVSIFFWLPHVAVFIYSIAFSLGMGPIPWLLLGEMFTDDIKCFAGSIVATINWLCAFVVVLYFPYFTDTLGLGITFWIFAFINVLAVAFGTLMLTETKNRTIDDIQAKLNE